MAPARSASAAVRSVDPSSMTSVAVAIPWIRGGRVAATEATVASSLKAGTTMMRAAGGASIGAAAAPARRAASAKNARSACSTNRAVSAVSLVAPETPSATGADCTTRALTLGDRTPDRLSSR